MRKKLVTEVIYSALRSVPVPVLDQPERKE